MSKATYTLLSWLRPPLLRVLDAGAVGSELEDSRGGSGATVRLTVGAAEEGGEVVVVDDKAARMLLTTLAAMSAWSSPAMVPWLFSQQVSLTLSGLRGQ